MSQIFDIIKDRASTMQLEEGDLAIFIAGPIDEDYDPKVDNHHWEIATLVPLAVSGLVIDLNKCEVVAEENKVFLDCHDWLSLSTCGREHTLGVLFVRLAVAAEVMQPLAPTTLSNGQFLPLAVTFIGRNETRDFENVITQWHEELLKFFIPAAGG